MVVIFLVLNAGEMMAVALQRRTIGDGDYFGVSWRRRAWR
jgi:hypothetical protein